MSNRTIIAILATLVSLATAVGLAAMMNSGTESSLLESIGRYDRLPPEAYGVVAEVRAKPGMEKELRDATLPLVAAVRGEPKNLLYFLHEDRESPGHFIFYEIFATRADFEAHNATPHVKAWFAKLSDLADGGVKVIRMEILGNNSTPRR